MGIVDTGSYGCRIGKVGNIYVRSLQTFWTGNSGLYVSPEATEAVGVLLLLRAFASGCAALTGVEAIANAVPAFRKPRIKHAQNTEMWLGITLGIMLIGLAILIRKFHVTPAPTQTVLAQLAAASLGKGAIFYFVQLITVVLLALAVRWPAGACFAAGQG